MVRFVPVFSLARITATPSLAQTRERRERPKHLLLAAPAAPGTRSAAFALRASRRGRPILETGAAGRRKLEKLALRDVDADGHASEAFEDVFREMAERLGVHVPEGHRVVRIGIAVDGTAEVTLADGEGTQTRQLISGETAQRAGDRPA